MKAKTPVRTLVTKTMRVTRTSGSRRAVAVAESVAAPRPFLVHALRLRAQLPAR
jgi:hypothetical protein